MRTSIPTLVLAICITGCASTSQVVPVGNGVYEIAGSSATALSSAGAQRVRLIEKANEYCRQLGKTVSVVDASGKDGQVGSYASVSGNAYGPRSGASMYGSAVTPGQRATADVLFRCTSSTSGPAIPETQPQPQPQRQSQTSALPRSYYERVNSLQEKLLSGDITASKGIVVEHVSPTFVPIPETNTAALEGHETWWIDKSKRWFIHIQNVTSFNLAAIEFSLNSGTCAKPTSSVRRTIIQLEHPIGPTSEAVLNFTGPITDHVAGEVQCGIISAAWRTPGNGV